MASHGNWTLVFSAGSVHEAELVKGRLEENGIGALLMNNGASVYPPLCEVAVYVDRDHALQALHVLGKPNEG
ncbi:MAG: DUF2007 domain-containing protein [Flavobacteriales bacterium]|nr:DUF2007 domain-containing protein [Flavobacteriales bacterium]